MRKLEKTQEREIIKKERSLREGGAVFELLKRKDSASKAGENILPSQPKRQANFHKYSIFANGYGKACRTEENPVIKIKTKSKKISFSTGFLKKRAKEKSS